MVDLKPCPFCGGNAEELYLEDEANFGGSVICCQKCGASSPVHFDRKENLYDSWNRRTEAKQDDEPVAWRVTYASGEVVFLSDKPVGDSGVYECEPLFARPVPPTGSWSDYFDNIRDAIDGCQDADWDSEQAAKSVIRTLDYLNLAPPAPTSRTVTEASEHCPDCDGTGFSNHPDSGQHCYRCNGQGAIHPEPAGDRLRSAPKHTMEARDDRT